MIIYLLAVLLVGIWLGTSVAWWNFFDARVQCRLSGQVLRPMPLPQRLWCAFTWLPRLMRLRAGDFLPTAMAAFVSVLIVAALALAIAGCAPMPTGVTAATDTSAQPVATAQGDSVVLTGARAFAAAELAYITAADAVGRLTDIGFIHGQAAGRARDLNRKARAALVTGKAATSAAAQAEAAAKLFGFADGLDLLSGRKS